MTNNAARDISRVGSWLFGNYWAETASSPFYTYYWSHAPPGQTAGAYHMSEINYCFDNLYDTDSPWEADDYAIADVMSTYWANFVKNLDPNGGNVTYWPASVASSNTTMHLDVTQEVMEIATADKIEFIKKYFAVLNTVTSPVVKQSLTSNRRYNSHNDVIQCSTIQYFFPWTIAVFSFASICIVHLCSGLIALPVPKLQGGAPWRVTPDQERPKYHTLQLF